MIGPYGVRVFDYELLRCITGHVTVLQQLLLHNREALAALHKVLTDLGVVLEDARKVREDSISSLGSVGSKGSTASDKSRRSRKVNYKVV